MAISCPECSKFFSLPASMREYKYACPLCHFQSVYKTGFIDVKLLRDEVANLSQVHRWQFDSIVECILYRVPFGVRIVESEIRQVLDGINVKTGNLASTLERFYAKGE
jgi:hypothetical protein